MSACRYPVEVGDPAGRRYERVEALSFTMSDGRTATRSVGVVSVRAAGRVALTLAVFGDEDAPVQLGEHTLLVLRLTIDESRRTLVPARGLSPGCVAVKGYEGATVAAGVQRGTPA